MQKNNISPRQLKKSVPIKDELTVQIKNHRKELINIFSKKSPKIPIIIGPCSIHDETAALEYAHLLKESTQKFSGHFFIVMRFFLEKSRSFLGWKGFLSDPDLNYSCNLEAGLYKSRQLLLKASQILPLAYEFVDPYAAIFVEDFITYGIIGARNVYSVSHKNLASRIPCPIGFKNALDGNILSAINAAIYAMHPHNFLYPTDTGMVAIHKSNGNPNSSIILRGSLTKPNFSLENIFDTLKILKEKNANLPIIVDCSHGNANPNKEQITAIKASINNFSHINGMMIESFLKKGSQPLSKSLEYGVSITDDCLGLRSSIELLEEGLKALAVL